MTDKTKMIILLIYSLCISWLCIYQKDRADRLSDQYFSLLEYRHRDRITTISDTDIHLLGSDRT